MTRANENYGFVTGKQFAGARDGLGLKLVKKIMTERIAFVRKMDDTLMMVVFGTIMQK